MRCLIFLIKTVYLIFKGGERCKFLEVKRSFFFNLFIAMNCTEFNHKIMCIDSIVENKLDTLRL